MAVVAAVLAIVVTPLGVQAARVRERRRCYDQPSHQRHPAKSKSNGHYGSMGLPP